MDIPACAVSAADSVLERDYSLTIVFPNRLQPVRNLLFRIRRGKQIPRFARNNKG